MIDQFFTALSLCLVILSFPYAIYNYRLLPNAIPVHVNIKGEIDQYGSKLFIFIFPVLLTAIFSLLKMIPKYDKYSKNYLLFKSEYNLFTVTVVSFISYVEFLFIELSRQQYDLLLYIMPGLGITLVISGFCVERSKMTQYFGCKNKWAYTSQENWTNFNFLGGLVMKVSGVMLLTGFFIKNKIVFVIAIVFTIIGVISVHLYGDAQMRRIEKEDGKKAK